MGVFFSMKEYIEIGKIVNTRGIKGEVKVIPYTDDPRRYDKLKWVYLSLKIENNMKKYTIEEVKYFKNFVILKFKDIDSIEEGEKLKNYMIIIDRKDAVKLPENSYFITDLIGMEVVLENGEILGILDDVLKTGSNDVYVVKDSSKKEILVPALKTVIKDISLENNKMVVELPEGLIDDEI